MGLYKKLMTMTTFPVMTSGITTRNFLCIRSLYPARNFSEQNAFILQEISCGKTRESYKKFLQQNTWILQEISCELWRFCGSQDPRLPAKILPCTSDPNHKYRLNPWNIEQKRTEINQYVNLGLLEILTKIFEENLIAFQY